MNNKKLLAGFVVPIFTIPIILHPLDEELHHHPDPPQYHEVYTQAKFTNPSTSHILDITST